MTVLSMDLQASNPPWRCGFHSLLQVTDSHQGAQDQQKRYQSGRMAHRWVYQMWSELIYSRRWDLGNPTPVNISHPEVLSLVYFPNRTPHNPAVRDVLEYLEQTGRWFTTLPATPRRTKNYRTMAILFRPSSLRYNGANKENHIRKTRTVEYVLFLPSLSHLLYQLFFV